MKLSLPRLRLSKRYTATKCGHRTTNSGDVTAFEQTIQVKMPVVDKDVEYCLECISGMTIQCAWCKLPIFIADPVTLYTPSKATFKKPDHAVVYRKHPLQLVGCLRWDCAQTGGDRSGFWLPGEDGHGAVTKVMSPIEQVMATGKSVFVSDIADARRVNRGEEYDNNV